MQGNFVPIDEIYEKLQYLAKENLEIKHTYNQGLPLVILFQPAASLSEKDSMRLQEEGQNLADSLQSPFIEVSRVAMMVENRGR